MSIGISDEHVELGTSLRKWAASLDGRAAARAAEGDVGATFADAWTAATEMGVPTIGLPESAGGGGGSVLDVAVALEAAAHELVPGPLLGTAVAAALVGETPGVAEALGAGARVALALDPSLTVVWDLPGSTHLLRPDGDGAWHVLPPPPSPRPIRRRSTSPDASGRPPSTSPRRSLLRPCWCRG